MQRRIFSIVVSVFNEERSVRELYQQLMSSLDQLPAWDCELIWVDDGSIDRSRQEIISLMEEEAGGRIVQLFIEFSKNFGHEAAMIAGIDHAGGEAVICLDADGQHPCSKIREMLEAYDQGADIVRMKRVERKDERILQRWLSHFFYRILNLLSSYRFDNKYTDFFLISAPVAEVLRKHYRERSRFIRGIIQIIGFSVVELDFTAKERKYGKSSYSYWKLLKLGMNAIFSFSNRPLRLTIFISLVFILFTLFFGGYSLYIYFFRETPPSGYTSIVLFLSASFSILFITLTVLALYFEKALEEIRERPIYLIKNISR